MPEHVAELSGDSRSRSRAANLRRPQRDCLRPRSATGARAALSPQTWALGPGEGPVGAAHPDKGSGCPWGEKGFCRRS